MANKATDNNFTYVTKADVKVRSGPGTGYSQTGSVDKGYPVYSDEMPKKGADGLPWLKTTVGYICSNYLELTHDKTPSMPPTPSTPAELAAMIAEVEGMIIRLTTLRAMLERYGK